VSSLRLPSPRLTVLGLLIFIVVQWLWLAGPAHAQEVPIASVRVWQPAAGQDNLQAARAAFRGATARRLDNGFQTGAREPVWYAIEVAAGAAPGPWVLELTHPSVIRAQLYLPQAQGEPVMVEAGRVQPAQQRARARFPATFQIPVGSSPGAQTFYLRVVTAVPALGSLRLVAEDQWADDSERTILLQSASFVAAFAVLLFATWRALRRRSAAWGYFAALCLSASVTRIFVTGFGEAWLWPALTGLRGPFATTATGFAAGSALLLFRSAFTLDVRAPTYSRWLLRLGVALPLAGLLALPLPLHVQQAVAQTAGWIAIVMGLSSIFLAWRTANRVALWLLGGFSPVAIGAAITLLGTAGVWPFQPWMLLVIPFCSMLQLPFNLRGLFLLEKRQALVQRQRAKVAQDAGPPGESRPHLAERLEQASAATGHAPATLMLLRLEGLAPGSPTLREIDAVSVERYIYSLMEFAVHARNHTGRWSFHELPLLRLSGSGGVSGLLTALFAQALRCDAFGIRARDVSLRIAFARFDGQTMHVADGLALLSAALDDPSAAEHKRVAYDLVTRRIIPPAPRSLI
jgi:hypothetical protein